MKENPWIKDFPQLKKDSVYFDSAATSLKPQSVIDKVSYYYTKLSTNIHRGMYEESIEATDLYEATRAVVADFINAKPEEIVYTRGTTSGLNLVAFSYGMQNLTDKDEIIVSELEHSSSILPWQIVAKRTGAKLKFVKLDEEGRIGLEHFQRALTERTKVVALTYVSNVMGYITPLQEIIASAHKKGAVVVVDAAQAIQHIKVDVKALDCDFLAFSGHKMCGPTGVGILYGKTEYLKTMEPFEYGGDMTDEVNKDKSNWKEVQQKFEAGTMPIASVIGLAEAIRYLQAAGLENVEKYVNGLYRYTYEKLSKIDGITIYNENSEVGIIAFNIDNVPSHDAITFFADRKISMRAGQHCAKLIHDWLEIYSSLRVSLYLYNTYEDADRFIAVAKAAVEYFQELGF